MSDDFTELRDALFDLAYAVSPGPYGAPNWDDGEFEPSFRKAMNRAHSILLKTRNAEAPRRR